MGLIGQGDLGVLNPGSSEQEAFQSSLSEKLCFQKVLACLGIKKCIWLLFPVWGTASKDIHKERKSEQKL